MLKNSPKRKYTFCIPVEHLRCPPCWTNYMCKQFKLHVTGACRQWRERERESSHERKRGKGSRLFCPRPGSPWIRSPCTIRAVRRHTIVKLYIHNTGNGVQNQHRLMVVDQGARVIEVRAQFAPSDASP